MWISKLDTGWPGFNTLDGIPDTDVSSVIPPAISGGMGYLEPLDEFNSEYTTASKINSIGIASAAQVGEVKTYQKTNNTNFPDAANRPIVECYVTAASIPFCHVGAITGGECIDDSKNQTFGSSPDWANAAGANAFDQYEYCAR